VKTYHKNPRTITKQQYGNLEAWLDELGDLSGIVHDLNSDEIPAGNQRSRVFGIIRDQGNIVITEALDEPTRQGTVARGYIEWHGERYSYRQVRWTPRQCEKANIIANKAGGEFEWETLANEFEFDDLIEWGFDEETLLGGGFSFDDEPTPDPGAQVDKAAELQEKWGVARGQVWQCGDHFIICGDCREPDTWTRLLGAAGVGKVNGVFTSPPYAEQRKEQYGGVPVDEYVDWWDAVQANVRANLAEDGSFFVNIKPHCEDGERVLYVFDLVLAMRRRWGWRFVDELCWSHQGVPGYWPNRFKNGFEPIYQFSLSESKFRPKNVSEVKNTAFKGKGGGLNSYYDPDNAIEHSTQSFVGDVLPSNRISANFPSASTEFMGHGAQFPVGLSDFFVRAYSDPGDVWLDPFLGSGTTIVAAHQNERRGLGIEMLEKYVSVSLERMAGMGLEPKLVANSDTPVIQAVTG